MNEAMESIYYEYRPLYRPIPSKFEETAYGLRPKWHQRESAYVSRKRMWRTLPEPSSPSMYDNGPFVRPMYYAHAAVAQLIRNGNGTTQIGVLNTNSVPSAYARRIRGSLFK
jgi:hypothetical protein